MTVEMKRRIADLDAILSDPECSKQFPWNRIDAMNEELQMLQGMAGTADGNDLAGILRDRRRYRPVRFDAEGRIR
jgi:hypothetical protein